MFFVSLILIASNCSSLPEVAGKAALLVDPENYTSGVWFTDAVVSGQSQQAYEAGYPYSKYHTISGLTNLVT